MFPRKTQPKEQTVIELTAEQRQVLKLLRRRKKMMPLGIAVKTLMSSEQLSEIFAELEKERLIERIAVNIGPEKEVIRITSKGRKAARSE